MEAPILSDCMRPWLLRISSVCLLLVLCTSPTLVYSEHNSSSSCPLDFSLLRTTGKDQAKSSRNTTYQCISFVQALHFVLVDYVARSGFFLVPSSAAEACWTAFDRKLSSRGHATDVRAQCNFTTNSIALESSTCKSITSVRALKAVMPQAVLADIFSRCSNTSIERLSKCSSCTVAVVQATTRYLSVQAVDGSINSCEDILILYAASAMADFPSRSGVATCLLNLESVRTDRRETPHLRFVFVLVGAAAALLAASGMAGFCYHRRWMRRLAKLKLDLEASKEKMAKSNSNLVWYTLDEIKAATSNFSCNNVLGSGGFGNVYKGVLKDQTVVAVKRFKNCSPEGEDEFFHEVEVISSVKHRNLVALRGCCVDKTNPLSHQRIIVYDYMPNGSLHDHLFSTKAPLDWPKRHNVALGIVRGLAYLHQEVQPAILHRDIKASNILLDANWNARVADFGLAKFTPDGATHVTTRVAGTHGYVAPEYVLYGKLNEKSDVYSFGVLLLELLTGRKSLKFDMGGAYFIADWAWSLVKQDRLGDVLDPRMDNLEHHEVVQKFVLIGLLCAHPHVYYRPTIDQVLKLMETEQPLPIVPDRPIPYSSEMSDIIASSPREVLSTSSGFRSMSSHSDLAR